MMPRERSLRQDHGASAHVAVHLDRAEVLVEHHALGVAHRDGAVQFVGPGPGAAGGSFAFIVVSGR